MPPPCRVPECSAAAGVRLSEVLSALSLALDLTEGQPEGHTTRSALIGMRIAEEIRLPAPDRSSLFYALLLKDVGCSSNAAKVSALFGADDRDVKHGLKTIDWTSLPRSLAYAARKAAGGCSLLARVRKVTGLALRGPGAAKPLFEIRCERGAGIARLLGFPEETAQAIRALDEHWDGRGYPQRLRRGEIPLLARILGLAQTAEVFFQAGGVDAALQVAGERRGKWFDPELVRALLATRTDGAFWRRLSGSDPGAELTRFEPEESVLVADDARLDLVAEGFARVIDAKSPWTFRHSEGVAELATGVAGVLGFSAEETRTVRRAALLHDIGKLGISNQILDKPGRLTDAERCEVQRHAELSRRILERVSPFRCFAGAASAHHERLDGKGYDRGLNAEQLTPVTRILCVADVYEAMSAERPYRPAVPGLKVLEAMARDAGTAFCPESFAALKTFLEDRGWVPRARGEELVRAAESCAAGG